MRIIPMNEQHISDIARLEQLCFSQPWSADGLRAELNNPKAHFLTAVAENDSVAGYIGMHQILDEGYIANVAVFPEYRGQKVASRLIAELQKLPNLSFISLEVRVSNLAAIALYEKMGFVRAGIRRGFYSAPAEDGLIMTWNSKGDAEI